MDNIFDWSYDELKEWFKGRGEGSFRAKQLLDYLYKGAESFEDMKNLNGSSIEKLKEAFVIYVPQVIDKRVSKDGTVKMLLALSDGNIIETVVMKYVYGYSVCVSSQVGCAMGCSFCASTKGGMVRNLLPGEILGQVLAASKEAGERMSHIVLMGSGEPLDNFENVLKFLELVNMKEGLGLSHRNITLSTCGLVDKIRELADMKLQITLAISLHAVTDDKRREIMPIARRWSIAEILDSVRYYMDTTGRRVSFEYSLVNGVNDSLEDAYALAALLRGMKTHVNLIPVNVIKEMLFRPSQNKAVESFRNALDSRGIEATVRREMGSDIDAACGQLRRSYLDGM
ncbi:23S rRNA (adenine(2503)-C(2))-methyltransferase RlmN [Youngiibacter multivorans]|uniref:Probable dual-specificity RNA methyltransferase RlmN n=1 Tax=Youngiibacter multivorans TaxID=937251 RepID=A0ABS4G1Z3_9CLOT|nr:23S rRNA (adenine(2503)-C(2))-methyltransferase RlmN [Youngiibacter multivorans]MBP1918566.1 23S rRNA (adenine2503-C2)-methyltransferase [Youngiibacter multivorans]